MPYILTMFTALLAALQTLALMILCDGYWGVRRALRPKWAVFGALSLAAGLGVYVLCRFVNDTHMTFSFLYTMALQLPLCVWLFRGGLLAKGLFILYTNVLHSIGLLLSLMLSILLLPVFSRVHSPTTVGFAMNLLFQLATFGILFLTRAVASPKRLTFLPPAPYWVCIYAIYGLIYAASVYVSDVLIKRNLVTGVTPIIETALLAVCVAVYLMFQRICQGYGEQIQRTLMEKQLSLQRAHLEELRASGDAMRKLRHELKNYMFYMQYLIDKKDFDALTQYFRDFYRKEYHNLVEVDSAGGILNAVLHQKLSVAEQYGIQIVDDLQCATPAEIDEQDLCILLSNLLDNAIEACQAIPNAVVTVRMRRVKEYLSLVVSNTIDRDVLKENPTLSTAKTHREIHGIGLRVIREIVRKYDGSVDFESGGGMFHAKLMLRIGGDGP